MSKVIHWFSKCKEMVYAVRTPRESTSKPQVRFTPPEIVPGVAPRDVIVAMDSANTAAGIYEYANLFGTHEGFMGYPALAQLTQKPEVRLLSEKIAQAMVRKWIQLKSSSDDDKSELIKDINKELERLQVRETFEELAKQDGFFGRVQLFVDLGEHDGEELATPMIMDPAKLWNKLRKFKVIEAMYSYPVDYTSNNPMRDSFYNPPAWYVMGQKVHSSRLLTFVGRPLPNILKPAYNFGGMSMTQLALPYIENWLSTRDHVNKLLRNFSITGVATNMAAALAGASGDDIVARADLYNSMRDNMGLFLLDKESEEMFQHNTPLSTLDKLQAQSQEQMSSISSIPLIVLFGISPTGLNASSEGELQTWYDFIRDRQESLFRENLKKVIEIIQISKYGAADPDITFDFVSMWEPDLTEAEQARKSRAETDQLYIDMGAISSDEVRTRLADDPDSGYTGLAAINPILMMQSLTPDDNQDPQGTEGADPEGDPPQFGRGS